MTALRFFIGNSSKVMKIMDFRQKEHRKHRLAVSWWRKVDSNHRSETQQIYSLPPLATRELLHMNLSCETT